MNSFALRLSAVHAHDQFGTRCLPRSKVLVEKTQYIGSTANQ
jgi:hypothetical protein